MNDNIFGHAGSKWFKIYIASVCNKKSFLRRLTKISAKLLDHIKTQFVSIRYHKNKSAVHNNQDKATIALFAVLEVSSLYDNY